MKEEITIGCNMDAAIEKFNDQREAYGLNPIPAHLFKEFTHMMADVMDDETESKGFWWWSTLLGEDLAYMNVEVLTPHLYSAYAVEDETANYHTCMIRKDGTLRTLHHVDALKQEFYFRLLLPFSAIRIDSKEDNIRAFIEREERKANKDAEDIIENATLTL